MVCDLWLVDLNPFCVSRFVAFDSNYDWRQWKTQLAAFELKSSHVCEKRSKPLCYLLPCQMCWQIPRKIFLRLGGLAIKSLINDVPQRFLACCSTVNTTFILFYTNSTLPFYCVVGTWYVVTYKSKSYLLLSFSPASAILSKVLSVLGLFEDWVWAGKICFLKKSADWISTSSQTPST